MPRKTIVEKVAGTIEVGHNDSYEVVVNLDHDRNGIGHLVFSAAQARSLAELLWRRADMVEEEMQANGVTYKKAKRKPQ